jgi:hypothetical protein
MDHVAGPPVVLTSRTDVVVVADVVDVVYVTARTRRRAPDPPASGATLAARTAVRGQRLTFSQ